MEDSEQIRSQCSPEESQGKPYDTEFMQMYGDTNYCEQRTMLEGRLQDTATVCTCKHKEACCERSGTLSTRFVSPRFRSVGPSAFTRLNTAVDNIFMQIIKLIRSYLWTNKRQGSGVALTFLAMLLASDMLVPASAVRYADNGPSLSGRRKPPTSGLSGRQGTGMCEPIQVPMCIDIGYNFTDMSVSPSYIYDQKEAAQSVIQFGPLTKTKCAEEMKLLVCSVYTPICIPGYPGFLPPCRFICEAAKAGCEPILKKYDRTWPNLFDCKQFPDSQGKNPPCLHFNRSATEEPAAPRTITKKGGSKTTPGGPVASVTHHPYKPINGCPCACARRMVKITNKKDPLYGKVTTGGVPNCAMPCKSPYFSEEKRKFAESWITVWSVVCFAITMVTVGTYLIDTQRFAYPERPIIFLSACYMFVSIGFIIRVVAGHEAVACAWHSDRVLYQTTGPFLCSIVFLLLYFFGMAGALWWVILSLTWFLAAGLKWGSEAIASYSQYFHAAAWLIPALKSITVLAMSSVDGDVLSGICFVGNQSTKTLRGFVLAPLVVYLALGGLFLFLGFVNLFRIRTSIKKVGKKTDTLEKLMGRIGLFSLLYMVPSAALVACYFYEQQNRELWAKAYNCRSFHGHDRCSHGNANGPEFAVFIVKYSMTLLIGITNGVWILSGKTVTSWRKFYRRCYGCLCGKYGSKAKQDRQQEDEPLAAEEMSKASDNSSGRKTKSDKGSDKTGPEEIPLTNSIATSSFTGNAHSVGGSDSKESGSSSARKKSKSQSNGVQHNRNDMYYECSEVDKDNGNHMRHIACDCDIAPCPLPSEVRGNPAKQLSFPEGFETLPDPLDVSTTELEAANRVQHIHHHHHHHVTQPPCSCGCHASRVTTRRPTPRRHSHHDPGACYEANHRKLVLTPPAYRTSPTTHHSLRR
ncbi:frizzled receptor [Ciona intestinalis]